MNTPTVKRAFLVWGTWLLLLGCCGTAQAGYWGLDRYEWSGEQHSETIKWGYTGSYPGSSQAGTYRQATESGYTFNKTSSNSHKIIPVSERARNAYTSDQTSCQDSSGCSTSPSVQYSNNGPNVKMGGGAKPGKGSFTYNIRPVFRWRGASDNEVSDTDLFIWEEGIISGSEGIRQGDGVGGPVPPTRFKGTRFTFSGVRQSLSKVKYAHARPWAEKDLTGWANMGFFGQPAFYSAYEDYAIAISNIGGKGETEISGPTRTFTGRIDLNTSYGALPPGGDLTMVGSAGISHFYQAGAVNMSIAIQRRKAGVPPSSGPFNTSSVAAGGYKTPKEEHWADVYVTISPALSGQKIVMRKCQEAGYLKAPEWEPNPEPFTDANGRVRIGSWLTSDLFIPNAELRVQQSSGDAQSSVAKFRQAWDEDTEVHYGGESHWQYNHLFDYGEVIPVTFRPAFFDTWSYGPWSNQDPIREKVRITKHTLNFMLGRIKVTGINASSSYPSPYPSTWIFTTNAAEINPWNQIPTVLVKQSVLDQLAICERRVKDVEEPGVYKTKVTIRELHANSLGEPELTIGGMLIKNASIDQVWMKAQDDEVYELVMGLFGNVEEPPTPQ